MLIDSGGQEIFQVKVAVSAKTSGADIVEQDPMEIMLGICDVISSAKNFAQKQRF